MFDIKNVDLSAVFAETQIINEGKPIGAVTVLALTPGGSFTFRVGTSQQFPVSDKGALININPNKEGNKGLFVTNAVAQAGVTAVLLIGYDEENNATQVL